MLSNPSRRKYKILIVDDSRLVLAITKSVLERAGMTVVALDSPIGFTRVLTDERPDLALIDVGMPALRGDELAKLVRRRLPNSCPIVLFSDRPEEELARLTESCGAAGYIRKSDNWLAVTSSILKFLEGAM